MRTDFNPITKDNRIVSKLVPLSGMAIQSGVASTHSGGRLFLEDSILLFVSEGNIEFGHGDIAHSVQQGQVAFFKKEVLIEYRVKDGHCKYLLFVLTKEIILEFTRLANITSLGGATDDMVIVSNPSPGLLRYIKSIQFYQLDEAAITEKLARIKLLELLLCLSVNDRSILKEVLEIRENFRPRITGIVEENIMNSLSIRQLARLAGRSLSSFRRDFFSIYNMPPSRWIRIKRLEKAQELLLNTNMTITDICYTLGFESVAHFSRIFKLHFRYPPSEVRLKSLVAQTAYNMGCSKAMV